MKEFKLEIYVDFILGSSEKFEMKPSVQMLECCSQKLQINSLEQSVMIGDSDNDFEMLNYADYSCIVKSSDDQNFVENIKSNNLFISNKQAPEGWSECINEAFMSIRRKK